MVPSPARGPARKRQKLLRRHPCRPYPPSNSATPFDSADKQGSQDLSCAWTRISRLRSKQAPACFCVQSPLKARRGLCGFAIGAEP